ncbi:MAG: hypothetical protein AAF851_14310 [Myxococcota bacterium]
MRLAVLPLVLVLLLGSPLAHADFMEGMVVSCPRNGEIWGTDTMRRTVQELKALGVDWIQIHPYAGIRRDGTVRFQRARLDAAAERGLGMIREAELSAFLKPHLAYWGSFSWRGAIEFETEAQWTRFFSTYTAWMLDQARMAQRQKVPVLVIGTELDGTVHRESEWRALIGAVRQVYDGYIVYAANWDRVESVPFWDSVDGIGVQAYFPLGEGSPSRAELAAAWAGPLGRLKALSAQHGDKPVVFAEIGYATHMQAAARPWEPHGPGGGDAQALRERLVEVALDELPRHPFVAGAFWWKWIPGWNVFQRDYSMRTEAMQRLIRDRWR